MGMTKRVQFFFPDDLLTEIERESQRREVSMAQFVREAVNKYLEEIKGKSSEKDTLDELAGFIEIGTDLSENHDKYLYGEKA
ncbi:MAG: ribbon-helix-helix protein, CopG family [Prolixibacteraceae bacterium]|nr:ribbon-helix-helix protein, CopG family [Prolixibacteraceae bacterium]